ncbi:MAG: hypothetical protein JW850_12890 [Thermoflexales bacterium]|nr:hypothetical protein [Thermoflexales bacterium]
MSLAILLIVLVAASACGGQSSDGQLAFKPVVPAYTPTPAEPPVKTVYLPAIFKNYKTQRVK